MFEFENTAGSSTQPLFSSTWHSPTSHDAHCAPQAPTLTFPILTLQTSLLTYNNSHSLSRNMLCSAPTAKSGSKWLDRLRSSKGIPTGDDLDLDSFLLSTAHQSTHTHTPPSNPTRIRPPDTHREPPSMTAILAELFNMGATFTKTQPFKKCPRKQTNPKFFLASSSSPSSATNTAVKTAVITAVNSLRADVVEEEKDEPMDRDDEEEGNELKGFSRSEVTMIDTSFPGWKVDKLVFRKNSVWKVRERKQKSKFLAKKKKKSTDVGGIGTSK